MNVFGPEAFDFVYTGIGALCWLPSVVTFTAYSPHSQLVAGVNRARTLTGIG